MRRPTVVLLAFVLGCGKSEPPPAPATGQTEAQRLLSEAGFPGGKGFPRLNLLYNTSESHKKIAAAIQESWRKQLGIEIELVNTEWKVFIDRVDRGDFEIARRAWIGEYLDPHAFLDLFTRESGQNPTGWGSDEYESLISASDGERDSARRKDLLTRAEDLLLREAPMFPIYHYVAHNWVKPFVKGVFPNSRDMHPLQSIRLEGEGSPQDGALIFNSGEEPNSLDPALSHDIAGLKILMHLFEGLANYDPRDASPVPAAAERWDVSEDGKTWTFHLREARWSNGDPLRAGDFVYAWRRVLDPDTASKYAQRLYLIRGAREVAARKASPETLGVRAPDDRTLVVELAHAAPYFAQLVCLNLFYPVHRATLEKHGKEWTKPDRLVGNGPYRMTSWKIGDRKVFEKNPLYRDASRVALQKVVFAAIPDANAALRMYNAGQLHWLFQAPTDQMDSLMKRSDYVSGPANSVYFYSFNTKKKPLDDVRVRRALSLAVDREKIVKYILRGGETAADRLVPPPSQLK